MGAPIKYTEAIGKKICQMIKQGSWLETAAECVGVTRETLRVWLIRGNEAIKQESTDPVEVQFADFVEAVQKTGKIQHEVSGEVNLNQPKIPWNDLPLEVLKALRDAMQAKATGIDANGKPVYGLKEIPEGEIIEQEPRDNGRQEKTSNG